MLNTMPTTAKRILRHGLLAALMLGALGYVYAQFAGLWFDTKAGAGGAEVTEALQWRVPLTMAAWGFGLVAVFEFFAGLWRTPEKPTLVESKSVPDAETLLLELLDQAEAAERERKPS